MDWKYIYFSIFMIIIGVECTLDDCNYHYKFSCYDHEPQEKVMTIPDSNLFSCNLENIPDEAKYTLILPKNGSFPSSTGIMKVNVNLPSVDCIYNVGLLVNDNITNDNECRQYDFENEFNRELHSKDQTICLLKENKIKKHENNSEKCNKDDILLYFQHVYTGCYALRYTIGGYEYAIRSRKYIKTNYQRTEIKEPKFYCTYDDRNDIDESRNLVTFTFSISIFSGSSNMILKLIPLSYSHENKEDACIKYSRASQYAWEIINGKLRNLDGMNKPHNNCNSMMVYVANGTYTEDIECSLALPVSYNDSYCFLIAFNDERCMINSVWNPPPRINSSASCTWMSKCTRIIKASRAIEYNGELQKDTTVKADTPLLLPIAIGLILMILIIFGGLIWINRLRMQRNIQQEYLNANSRDLKIMNSAVEGNGIDELEDDNEKSGKLLDDKAIVLLYAKGPKSYMEFMSNFRDILELYCTCHVYDWYAACEWDAVARVSACEWAGELFKKNYRTVWIDTPTARSLITAQITNDTNLLQSNLDSISDFRDIAFPAVLNCAKRSIVDAKLQYSKHFIVRLEGHNNENSADDPFADLSPHARYLIPYHLSQLCSHLSSKRSDNCGHTLMIEETKLRKQLMQLKNDY
ncbi:hypothetical protein PV328_001928 [Microctonus aethiopoides]|uniref:Uncharacterized protein n=1 Tax=Microctonus aethiopoides TaxID=144406 RepID=A0AA39FY13_9HYME|nr:hypothetical protein PV328_001928 [Microctonus aethiopoides]